MVYVIITEYDIANSTSINSMPGDTVGAKVAVGDGDSLAIPIIRWSKRHIVTMSLNSIDQDVAPP